MARVSGPLMSQHASGSVAKRITFRATPYGQVATRYHYPGSVRKSNPSAQQLLIREKYTAAHTSWTSMTATEQGELNDLAAQAGMSGWNLHLRNSILTEAFEVEDLFNEPNNALLLPPWISSYTWTGFHVISGQVAPVGSGNKRRTMLFNDVFNDNQWAQIVIAEPGTQGNLSIILRGDSNGSGVYFGMNNSGRKLWVWVAGVFTQIQTIAMPEVQPGDTVRFEAYGNVYTGLVNGQQQFSITYQGLQSGLPGMYAWTPDVRIEEFRAGNL